MEGGQVDLEVGQGDLEGGQVDLEGGKVGLDDNERKKRGEALSWLATALTGEAEDRETDDDMIEEVTQIYISSTK